MSFIKINNAEIKKISLDNDEDNYTYKNIFDKPFFNLLLLAETQGGKSQIIYNLIFNHLIHVNKKKEFNTKLNLFVTTVAEDKLWLKIIQKLEKNKVEFTIYEDYYKFNEDINNLQLLLQNTKNQYDELKEKYRKIKYALYINIFDDYNVKSDDGRLYHFMKKSRHYNVINIFSLQSYKNMSMNCRDNVLYLFLLNSNINYLKEIWMEYVSSIFNTFDDFLDFFKSIKNQNKYNFLFLNRKNPNDIRLNLSLKYVIKNE